MTLSCLHKSLLSLSEYDVVKMFKLLIS